MTLEDLLQILADVAKRKGLNTPYIVGGVPRSIVLGKLNDIIDVDITTGSSDVVTLAYYFAHELGKELHVKGKHSSLKYGGISFDFSTNFMYDQVDSMLIAKGVSNPTDLIRESYSRDFTCNTLLLDMNLKSIIDITGRGRDDIINQVLSCPLDCDASFEHDPKRILRAFHFRARHGFTFSDEVYRSILKNVELLSHVKVEYSSSILNRMIEANPKIIDDLVEMGVMKYLPLTKYVTEVLLKNRKILDVI